MDTAQTDGGQRDSETMRELLTQTCRLIDSGIEAEKLKQMVPELLGLAQADRSLAIDAAMRALLTPA